ncbi:MAG: PIG-L deacetylase family protein [Candidatus Helarchaeota archaeon]
MRFLFIAAHPDDLEATISELVRFLSKKQDTNEILIACMTKGEFGTMDSKLRGRKMADIRVREYSNVLKIYGLNAKKNLRFLDLIDGSVTIKAAKKKIIPIINEYEPDVIFAPEYQFGVYHHSDHVNTGKAVLSILQKELESGKPKLFVYQSFKNTNYFPADIRFCYKVLTAHKSQFQVIGFLYPMLFLFQLINGLHFGRLMWAQGVRRITTKKIHLSFKDRFLYHLFKKGELLFHAWNE